MYPEIIEKLKKLKSIKPESDFVSAARLSILTAPKPRRFIFFLQNLIVGRQVWIFSGAVAVLLLALIISITSFNKISVLSTLTDSEEIDREFKNLNINIQLQEISYRQSVNEVIASALGEISDDSPNYLKSSILERELNSFKINDNLEKREEIKELLNKIIF